tara:strand:- start:1 stop:561 length:561 start_codon:yes stop_codon:yes gene_type:complete
MQTYSVEDYVADIRAVVAEETTAAAISERIKPLSKRLAADRMWFEDTYRKIDGKQGFGLHLLHEEDNHDLAVFVISWAPGKGLAAHNHKTWAVVTGIEGQEHETNYRRLDDCSRPGFADLEKSHEATLFPGDAVCCMPEDIHSVWNNGTELAVSLHTYGRHLNHTGRSIFDVAEKSEIPCVVKVEE